MKKYIELILNSLLNFALALVAGGVLKTILEYNLAFNSLLVIIIGVYLFIVLSFTAYLLDKKK